jgi:hypothetical protein
MERMIGLILIVTAIWVGVEFYTEGDQAFGGIFASGDAPAASSASSSGYAGDSGAANIGSRNKNWAGERVREKVTGLHQERGDRIDAVED